MKKFAIVATALSVLGALTYFVKARKEKRWTAVSTFPGSQK